MAENQNLFYFFKMLVILLGVSLCWWLWPPLGVAETILLTGYMRRPIVSNAAFWTGGKILGVGLLWGIAMAVAVRWLSGLATSSSVVSVALYLEGLVAVAYVGYRPAPEDLAMYNKARETAAVGVVSYLLVVIGLVLVRGWVR